VFRLATGISKGHDRSMGAWIVVAVAALAGIVIAGLRRRSTGGGRAADVDVGPVSEGWLSEQRGRKDS
jgi:hypothetical protein